MTLIDAHGRKIDYLRISITDHCNLNCRYCMPAYSRRPLIDRAEILSYEELLKIADAAVAAGISKIRITGGEPLVRRDMTLFCRMLGTLQGLQTLALTTNGVRLAAMADDLFQAGVRRINISLDTLQPKRFQMITGKDCLAQVLAGIKAAQATGFDPIKINTVIMRGVNDDEIAALAGMIYDKPYHVRFIELMPFQNDTGRPYDDLFMPVDEIIPRIPQIDAARRDETTGAHSPAELYTLPGAKGKLGFIAPMSRHFCGDCNRLRLTADGKLRTCLFAENEIDLKSLLRAGASKETLSNIFRSAAFHKPRRHHLCLSTHRAAGVRAMHAIGG